MLVPLPTSCTHLTFFASYYFSIILSESQFISLKCHGIYTLNEWNLWHVNYTSIRLFKSDGNGTSLLGAQGAIIPAPLTAHHFWIFWENLMPPFFPVSTHPVLIESTPLVPSYIKALWKTNDLSSVALQSRFWLARALFILHMPLVPRLCPPTPSSSRATVSPALFIIAWVLLCTAAKALSLMSLAWKVIQAKGDSEINCIVI